MEIEFDISQSGSFSFEFENRIYVFSECLVLADLPNFTTSECTSIVKTLDGKHLRLDVKAKGPEYFQNGITKGSYSVSEISEKNALGYIQQA